ncbi:thioesterase [Bacteroidia bacterium]|nr:thioesterase [Bacteroidia bacterium]
MITRDFDIRVRYKETDAMGVVHHSNYAVYYEQARTEFLRSFGATYRELEQRGVMLPVSEVTMKFYKPARYDDMITVRITLPELPAVRLVFDHEVYNAQGELLNTGRVVLAYIDATTRRPCRAPADHIDLFREWF